MLLINELSSANFGAANYKNISIPKN
jgi:hypothetical protein